MTKSRRMKHQEKELLVKAILNEHGITVPPLGMIHQIVDAIEIYEDKNLYTYKTMREPF